MAWKNLTENQKKKFGGNKKNYKTAKQTVKKSGGNIHKAKNIVKAHKASSRPSPSPSRNSSPRPQPSPVSSRPGYSNHSSKNKPVSGAAKQVQNINRYDTTSYGSGSGKGADKLSGADIRELTRQGFSDQEVVDYVESKWRGGTKGGLNAQNLLNSYKDRIKKATAAPAAPSAPVRSNATTNTAPRPNPQPGNPAPDRGRPGIDIPSIIKETVPEVNIPDPADGSITKISQGNTQINQNTQDNDIITNIEGDNNVVTNNQDNSIRNYNGDQDNYSQISADQKAQLNKEIRVGGPYERQVGGGETTPKAVMPVRGTNMSTGNRNIGIGQGSTSANLNTQDNDIITDIVGDNNTVKNYQDNSIRNYGGDQRNFTYIGGQNPLYDSPVSAATMAGYYSPNDSPAAQAKFVDMFSDLNTQNQRRMRNEFDFRNDTDYAKQASRMNQFDPQAMEDNINNFSEKQRARATVGLSNIFGDFNKWNMKWTPSQSPSKIKSNVEDIAKSYDL